MSDILRRQKDLITRTVGTFKQATSTEYAKYFEGSPTYVTYYQLDAVATQQDTALENVHSLVGNSSPNKYKRINDVVIYGVDALSISNEITDKGLESLINGDFVLLPDSIRPYPGDFFSFDEEDLTDHLFRVNDVQYDKASPKKFYRCSFAVYPENNEIIFNNVLDDYILEQTTISGEAAAIVKKSDSVVMDKVKILVDSMIDKFINLFYDEDMDTFTCPIAMENEVVNFWSPYLHKFIHDTDIVKKYTRDFMLEIYVNDIGESSNKDIFNDFAYFNSIFKKIQIQEPFTFDNTFLTLVNYDLKETRNLPFFFAQSKYKPLGIIKNNASFLDSFHLLYQEPKDILMTYPASLKFNEGAEVDITQLSEGDIFYELQAGVKPVSIYRMLDGTPTSISFNPIKELPGKTFYNLAVRYIQDEKTYSGIISNITKTDSIYYYTLTGNFRITEGVDLTRLSGAGFFGANMSIDYIEENLETGTQIIHLKSTGAPNVGSLTFATSFKVDEELLLSINNQFMTQNIETYIFLPIAIYILKQKAGKV